VQPTGGRFEHNARTATDPARGDGDAGARRSGWFRGLRLKIFLMRRHSKMEFAPGVIVFPASGVDDRDRNARLGGRGAWAGPPPEVVGAAVRHRIRPWPRRWCCAAARETFEESGGYCSRGRPMTRTGSSATPRSTATPAAPWTIGRSRSRTSCAPKIWCSRSDLLRPWANWVTPEGRAHPPLRHLLLVAGPARGPTSRRREHRIRPFRLDVPSSAAIDDFEAGRNILLPPTWTQLDSLAGRSVADVLAVERQIVPVQPILEKRGDNWVFEFFDSDRYHQARLAGGSMEWPL